MMNQKPVPMIPCHGYSTTQNGAALLIQRPISWTDDGWPQLQ